MATVTTSTGMVLEVWKDKYTGLWNIWYKDGYGPKWAGPFKTKREAIEFMNEKGKEDA